MKKPVIIAHRGASAYAPENTMAAFKKALDMGTGGIELDVQLSRDGHVIVIHDEKLERTSNGRGWVKDMELGELRTLDFGSWFGPQFTGERIATLEQVLELLSPLDVLLNIEIKSGVVHYPGIEQKVVDSVRRYCMTEKTIISSFNHYSLLDVKKAAPEIRIGILYVAGLVAPWEYAAKLGAQALHPLFYSVVPDMVRRCRENGIAVNPYTVDQPELIRKLILMGVDGIITNVPDIALKVLDEMEDRG